MENPHAPRVFEKGRRVNLLEVCVWILGLSFTVLHGLYGVSGLLGLGLFGFRVTGLEVLRFRMWAIMGYRLQEDWIGFLWPPRTGECSGVLIVPRT